MRFSDVARGAQERERRRRTWPARDRPFARIIVGKDGSPEQWQFGTLMIRHEYNCPIGSCHDAKGDIASALAIE